jgi:DNA-binding PadR family transcriptional regulator
MNDAGLRQARQSDPRERPARDHDLARQRVSWSFQDLKAELKMSDGNLVTHLRTLHKLGFVAVTKEVLDRPQTSYAPNDEGARRLYRLPARVGTDCECRQSVSFFPQLLCHTKLASNPL